MPLNGKQKRHLRALGHHLSAVVQVGADGVTDGVVAAAAQALSDHELIKVKIAAEREEREESIAALVAGTGAEVAQTLGKTVLLFKPRKKKSKFVALLGGTPEPAEAKEGAAPRAPRPRKPASRRRP